MARVGDSATDEGECGEVTTEAAAMDDDEEMEEAGEPSAAPVRSTASKWTAHQNLSTLAIELLHNEVQHIDTFSVICPCIYVHTCTCTHIVNPFFMALLSSRILLTTK